MQEQGIDCFCCCSTVSIEMVMSAEEDFSKLLACCQCDEDASSWLCFCGSTLTWFSWISKSIPTYLTVFIDSFLMPSTIWRKIHNPFSF